MSPNVFGQGGGWMLSSMIGLLSFIVVLVLALDDRAAAKERQETSEMADLTVWHLRAEGDSTR
ncbi:MAG TPA: hypothetical protein VJT32_11205 [bacterium]|nr:hypothetical protein [bacterium]